MKAIIIIFFSIFFITLFINYCRLLSNQVKKEREEQENERLSKIKNLLDYIKNKDLLNLYSVEKTEIFNMMKELGYPPNLMWILYKIPPENKFKYLLD